MAYVGLWDLLLLFFRLLGQEPSPPYSFFDFEVSITSHNCKHVWAWKTLLIMDSTGTMLPSQRVIEQLPILELYMHHLRIVVPFFIFIHHYFRSHLDSLHIILE